MGYKSAHFSKQYDFMKTSMNFYFNITWMHFYIESIHLFKMLLLYLLTRIVYTILFYPYLSSGSYTRKHEKLPNKVIHACWKITEKIRLCWKSVARKGLGSLTNNFCPANFEKNHFTKSIKMFQWLQIITYLR